MYYIDETHPITPVSVDSLGVYKVNSIGDYSAANEQLQQLRDLYDAMGEEKDEVDDEAMAVSEAIAEQERQLSDFVKSVGSFDSDRFAQNLDILLKKNNLKMSELESILNLSTGYISRTIGNESKRKLSVEALWKIAGLFQINIDDLIRRDISEPTKDLKTATSFIEKLVEDTDKEKIRWDSVSTRPDSDNFFMFPTIDDKEVFVANSLPAENCGLVDAYSVNINVGELYFFRVKKASGGYEYSFYIFDEDILSSNGDDPFVRIMISRSDSSGILDIECDKLMNSIKIREKDFVVSKEARSYMDRFLNPTALFLDDDGNPLPFT